jgi:L-alanine-DL-glutamate epimerase-like enolase superfamily enzyme
MRSELRLREIRVHRLAIPLRVRFEHAAASRDIADPIIVTAVAAAPHAQHVGYGETLARAYVTGETPDSVLDDIERTFAPLLLDFRAASFIEALEQIDALPTQVGGRVVTGARAAVELALLDLACRVYRRRPSDIAGWMGLIGFGPPGCRATARYSGIVVGQTRGKLKTMLRLQRWYGLRDFKLKVATAGWQDRLAWAYEVLARPIAEQRATLRVDANAGWSLAEANEALLMLEKLGVCALEQPLPDIHDADLPYLAEQSACDLIVDESLLTLDDAERLIAGGGTRVLNIRIAKNGGLLPALRIARVAVARGLDVQLGCLVGETSILAAAGVAFLETCPRVRFVEGAFGRWLLKQDVTRQPVQFGYRGTIRARREYGLGVEVDPAALERLALERPRTINF